MYVHIFWEWDDFGIMLRVFKNTKSSKYLLSLDIQVAWLNVWIQVIKKERIKKMETISKQFSIFEQTMYTFDCPYCHRENILTEDEYYGIEEDQYIYCQHCGEEIRVEQ